MDRAGRAVAWEVRAAARRHLRARGRWSCAARATTAATAWSPRGCCRRGACGSRCSSSRRASHRAAFDRELGRADVAVDAMYGTGFRGALEGDAAYVAARLDASAVPVVAVDIPSGRRRPHRRDAAASRSRPRSTVTFAARKPGLRVRTRPHVRRRGHRRRHRHRPRRRRAARGTARRARPAPTARAAPPRRAQVAVGRVRGRRIARHDRRADVREPRRDARRCGHRVVRAPGRRRGSAASGTEVITKALPATDDGVLGSEAVDTVLADLGRFRALALGPGLGTEPAIRAAVRRLVADAPVPLVLDADGLNALAGDLDPLRARTAPHRGHPPRGRVPAPHRPPGGRRPGGRRPVAGRRRGRGGAAQGPGHGRRRPRRRRGGEPHRRPGARHRGQRRRAHRHRRRLPGPGAPGVRGHRGRGLGARRGGRPPGGRRGSRGSSRPTSSPRCPLRWPRCELVHTLGLERDRPRRGACQRAGPVRARRARATARGGEGQRLRPRRGPRRPRRARRRRARGWASPGSKKPCSCATRGSTRR